MKCVATCRICSVVLAIMGNAGIPHCAEAQDGRNYAFLVACEKYSELELRSLKYTRHDILELDKELRQARFAPENIVLMHDEQKPDLLPESKKIRRQLELLLAGLQEHDTVLVAFAGHGVQFQNEKKNYFCPRDTELRDRRTLIAMDELYGALDSCKAGRKLLLVDACRNDPRSDLARSRAVVDLESVTRPQTETVPKGIVALFSCSAGQQSFEHPEIEHGVFFHHVILGLRGKGDGNRDGKLTLDELSEFVSRETTAYARLKLQAVQVPQRKNDVSGDWIIRQLPRTETKFPVSFPHPDEVTAVSFASDAAGNVFWTGCRDRRVRLWSVGRAEEVRSHDGHAAPVTRVAGTHKGSFVVSGDEKGELIHWSPKDGRTTWRVAAHQGAVRGLFIDSADRAVVSVGDDGAIRWLSLRNGEEIEPVAARVDAGAANDVAWAGPVMLLPCGRRDPRTGNESNAALRLFSLRNPAERRIQGEFTRPVWSAAANPMKAVEFLTGDESGRVRLLTLGGKSDVRRFEGFTAAVRSVAFTPDGLRVLAAGGPPADGSAAPEGHAVIRIWNTKDATEAAVLGPHDAPIQRIAVSEDGRRVVAASGKTAKIWIVP